MTSFRKKFTFAFKSLIYFDVLDVSLMYAKTCDWFEPKRKSPKNVIEIVSPEWEEAQYKESCNSLSLPTYRGITQYWFDV